MQLYHYYVFNKPYFLIHSTEIRIKNYKVTQNSAGFVIKELISSTNFYYLYSSGVHICLVIIGGFTY